MQVVAKTLAEAKNWQRNSASAPSMPVPDSKVVESVESDVESELEGSTTRQFPVLPKKSKNQKGAKKVAATREAAQAALAFATRRGVAHKGKGDTAKPFIFRNRTGLPLVFRQQHLRQKENDTAGQRPMSDVLVKQV